MVSAQWAQFATLHQGTAQQINTHIAELFQGDAYSYSGPAANALWDTHQDYQQYFTVLVDHAQTQQNRYATLGGHFDDFLSQAPGKVSSLSTPMAALGVLGFETVATAAPPILEDPAVEGVGEAIEIVAGAGTVGLPEDIEIWPIILVILAILVIILVIVIIVVALRDATEHHQNQQKTTTVKPPPSQKPVNSLSTEQEKMAQRLHADYGHLGLSLDDIRNIIEANPHLTEAQLRELLDQYSRVLRDNPNLVKKYGALAVFLEFIALAAYDAGHGGNYPARQPIVNMPNLQEGIREADAEMGAMENGEIPWPLEPSTDPAYDATDAHGVKWDEKSYRSLDINGNAYDPENAVNKLQKDFGKGEKVIFDDSQLTQQEIDETYEELKKRGQEDEVVWWPTRPTQLS
ncbi:MAG TPA: hypothetical protein VGF67_12175 [Ktedonobacteraceae bacterium]